MKKTRRIWRILAITAIVITVGAGVLALRLRTVIRTAVNTMGPTLLGVPVSVESVAVYPLRGQVRLRTLTIGNPEGYSSEYLFRLDQMRLELDLRALVKGQTLFKEIVIEGPHVWYERKLTRSNVGDLLDILEQNTPADTEAAPQGDKPKKPVIIDLLQVREGTVGIKMGVGMKLPLPGIELKDIGKERALMPVQIVKLIIGSVFKGVLKVVAGTGDLAITGVKEVGSLATEGVMGAGRAVGGLAAGLGSRLVGSASPTNTPSENE